MSDGSPSWQRFWLTRLLPFVLLVSAFIVYARSLMERLPLVKYTGFSWLSQELAIALGCILLAAAFLFRYWIPLVKSKQSNDPIPLSSRQRYLLQELAGEAGSPTDIPEAAIATKFLAGELLSPASTRQRITERHEPGQRIIRKVVTVEVQIPQGRLSFKGVDQSEKYVSDRMLLIPVVIPPKGKLHDGFAMYDAEGRRVPVLTYAQYLQIVARLLRTLLLQSYRKKKYSELPLRAQEAERTALDCVMYRGVDGMENKKDKLEIIDHLLSSPEARPTNGASYRMFISIVDKLASHYALVAPMHCDADRRMVFTYEYTVVPAMRRSWSGLLDLLRIFVGARPIDISVDLNNAWACQSYHLILESGDGLFCCEQEVIPEPKTYFKGKKKVGGVPPYYRLRRRLGQPYAHFYSRFFPEPGGTDSPPRVRFAFKEVPPGSAFKAMIASASVAVLIWTIGFILGHTSDGKVGSDAPAFLLAFPAIAAAYMGFQSPPNRLLEATLVARVSLFCTAAGSIVASGLFMIYSSDVPVLHGKWPDHGSLLWVTEKSWSLLTLAAVLHAGIMAFICFSHSWEYRHLASRQRKDQEAIENG